MADPVSTTFTPGTRQSALKLLAMYAAYLMGSIAFLWVLLWAAERFFQFSPSSSAMGIILPMVAAMGVSGIWYKKEGERPASGRAWRIATLWMLFTIGLQLLMVYAVWASGVLTEMLGSTPRAEDIQIFVIVFAVLAVFQLLVLRLGIYVGFRGTAKQLEREAEKRAKVF